MTWVEAQQRIRKAKKSKKPTITVLDLKGLGLTELPPGIEELTWLKTLDLSDNVLPELPSVFGELEVLWRLDVSNNQLTSLPAELGQVETLEILDLRGNAGLSELPSTFANHKNLLDLFLDGTAIERVPEGLGELVDLPEVVDPKVLAARAAEEGRLRVHSAAVTRASSLNLSKLNLAMVPAGLAELKSLETLDLSHNQLTSLPSGLWHLTKLTRMDASHNQIPSVPQAHAKDLPALTTLNLSHNQLESLPMGLEHLDSLTTLDLSHNQIASLPLSDEEIEGLTRNLTAFDLTGNPLGGVPAEVSELAGLPALSKLPEARDAFVAWLEEQGGPRWNLRRVQGILENPPEGFSDDERAKLQAEEAALLDAGQREWLGSLATPVLGGKLHVRWSAGFVEAIEAPHLTEELAVAIKRFAELRFVRRFQARSTAAWALASLSTVSFPALEVLEIGERAYGSPSGDAATRLMKQAPRLRELWIGAEYLDVKPIFAAELPHLEKLALHGAKAYPLEILVANPTLKRLKELRMEPPRLEPESYDREEWYAHCDRDGCFDRGALGRVLEADLPELRVLELRRSSAGDGGIRDLIESGLLARLRELDLTQGEVTDEGARLLAEATEATENTRIVLDENSLTREGIKLLEEAGVDFSAKGQTQWRDREFIWVTGMIE